MRRVCHGPPFTMLVGTFSQPTNPSENDPGVRLMTSYTTQTFKPPTPMGGSGLTGGIMPDAATKPTFQGTVTVADNDFTTGAAYLTVGDHTLISNLDYLVGGAVGITATNLAAAIDNLPDFEASAVGPAVTITAPYILDEIELTAMYLGTKTNFTLVPATGFLAPTGPLLDPPVF